MILVSICNRNSTWFGHKLKKCSVALYVSILRAVDRTKDDKRKRIKLIDEHRSVHKSFAEENHGKIPRGYFLKEQIEGSPTFLEGIIYD